MADQIYDKCLKFLCQLLIHKYYEYLCLHVSFEGHL